MARIDPNQAVDLGVLQVPQVPAAIMSWRTRTAVFVLPDGTKMPVLECEMGGTNNMTFSVAMPPEMIVPFAAEMLAWVTQLGGSAPQTPEPDMKGDTIHPREAFDAKGDES